MASSIVIDLLMRTGAFETDTKRAERRMKALEREFKVIGRRIGLALAGVGAGIAAMVASSVNAAREIQNLSRLANTSAEDFQRFAFGADTVGISQEKLADILKDVSDRVGDFLTTGAGPMADFFEQIAPRVGVTAEQFRNLSGREGLLLFVDSLEKANLSQSEMIFFMEAMASDSSALLPLLRGNGEEMGRLGDRAERLGKVLSDVEIVQLLEVKQATDDLSAAWSGASNTLVGELIPTINTATQGLVAFSEDGETAAEVAGGIATALKSLASVAIGAATAVELIGKSIGGLTAAANAAIDGTTWYEALFPPLLVRRIASNSDDVIAVFEAATDDLQRTALRRAQILENMWNPPPAASRGVLERMFAELQLPRIASLSGGRRDGGDDVESVLPSGTDFDTSHIDDMIEGFERAAGFVANTRTEVERLEQQLAEAKELAAAGFFSEGRDEEVIERISERLDEARARVEQHSQETNQFLIEASRNTQDIIADTLISGFEDGTSGMLRSFADMLERMAAQAIAANIAGAIFGEDGVGSGGGLVGAFAKAFGGGRAGGGGVSAGMVYRVNEIRPEYFRSNTSGQVMPIGGGGGGVELHIHNDGNPLAVERTETSRGADGRMIVQAWVRNEVHGMIGRGELDRALTTNFGVRRRPA